MVHALAAHLSVPATAANIRLTARSFRRVSTSSPSSSNSELSLVFVCSSFLLHGCQVAPIFFDTHIYEIGPCPTVSSNDINPINISSLIFHAPKIKGRKRRNGKFSRSEYIYTH